jgi:hypothetical protein
MILARRDERRCHLEVGHHGRLGDLERIVGRIEPAAIASRTAGEE